MDRVRGWLEATECSNLAPDRERRIESQARQFAKMMRHEGRFFSVREATEQLQIEQGDLPLIRERVYELAVKWVLRTFAITDKDRAGLRWIARILTLSPEQTRYVEGRVGRRVFEEYFSFAMSGGFLDEEELTQLHSVTDGLQISPRELVMAYLDDGGQEFLHRIAMGLAEDGELSEDGWRRLLNTALSLGVAEGEFTGVLARHARNFAERIKRDTQLGICEIPVAVAKGLLGKLSPAKPSQSSPVRATG